jgi:hypothetical protein
VEQKGFIPLVIVIILALISAVGFYGFRDKIESVSITPVEESFTPTPQPHVTNTPIPTALPTTIATKNPVSRTVISIKGDENCKVKTQDALNLLDSKASTYYQTVVKYVGIIECTEKGSGMYAWEDPPRYQVGRLTYEASTIWYAGTIVHDSCHSKLYSDNLLNNHPVGEPAIQWTGEDAERKCINTQYDALVKIGADSATLDYVRGSIDSKYWEISPTERWW